MTRTGDPEKAKFAAKAYKSRLKRGYCPECLRMSGFEVWLKRGKVVFADCLCGFHVGRVPKGYADPAEVPGWRPFEDEPLPKSWRPRSTSWQDRQEWEWSVGWKPRRDGETAA